MILSTCYQLKNTHLLNYSYKLCGAWQEGSHTRMYEALIETPLLLMLLPANCYFVTAFQHCLFTFLYSCSQCLILTSNDNIYSGTQFFYKDPILVYVIVQLIMGSACIHLNIVGW